MSSDLFLGIARHCRHKERAALDLQIETMDMAQSVVTPIVLLSLFNATPPPAAVGRYQRSSGWREETLQSVGKPCRTNYVMITFKLLNVGTTRCKPLENARFVVCLDSLSEIGFGGMWMTVCLRLFVYKLRTSESRSRSDVEMKVQYHGRRKNGGCYLCVSYYVSKKFDSLFCDDLSLYCKFCGVVQLYIVKLWRNN